MKPFKIPDNVYFFPVNYDSGKISKFSEKKTISEPFKEESLSEIKLKNLGFGKSYDKLNKYRKFY